MNHKKTEKLVFSALVAALVFLGTFIIKVPSPTGYFNLGDGFIFAGATLLGPIAWIPAVLGSAMADYFSGYPIYILPTLVIKGIMGLVAGWILRRHPKITTVFLTFVLCELIMVGGYLLVETFMYGFAGAVAAVVSNLMQGAFGVLIGSLFYPVMKRLAIQFGLEREYR